MKNTRIYLSRRMLLLGGLLMFSISVFAQERPDQVAEKSLEFMQQAEEAVAENDFALAEAYYRKAIAKDPGNAAARYNLGNLYYKEKAVKEATQRLSQSAKVASAEELKHRSFHNEGNAFMDQKKYKEAVEAYKNALRNNPQDDKTRYNLALAKKMLEQQKKKGGGKDNKEQDKNQKNNQKKENKDQKGDQGENKKDQGEPKDQDGEDSKEKKENKDGEEKKDDKGKPEDQNKDQNKGKPEQGKQKPAPGQLSPQQIKNLLEAMANEEKKVQEKINARKAKGARVQTEKDW
ncbi:MAG TPA: tetratricopeptide repeat protein [Salinimicrobium sp.]|nr:tetratricopeptide repeat protein [Salinimicrobium sp.]